MTHSSSVLKRWLNGELDAPQIQLFFFLAIGFIYLGTTWKILEGESRTDSTSKNSLIVYLEPVIRDD